MDEIATVGDLIKKLQEFPPEMKVEGGCVDSSGEIIELLLVDGVVRIHHV